MQDKSFYIEWSSTDQLWQLVKTSMMGMRRSQKFLSKSTDPTVPTEGWRAAWGHKGHPPHIQLRHKRFRLQEVAETPCDEVSPGMSVKGTDGNLRGLCIRD